MIVLASTRSEIASYVDALFLVYIIIIFVYILLNLMFSMGLRTPYSRWSDAVLNFLRDVSDPYLRLFRRFIPAVGMFDFSPIIAILVLYLLRYVVHRLIAGGLLALLSTSSIPARVAAQWTEGTNYFLVTPPRRAASLAGGSSGAASCRHHCHPLPNLHRA